MRMVTPIIWVLSCIGCLLAGSFPAYSDTLQQVREWEAKQARAEVLLATYPIGASLRDADPVSFAMLTDTLAKRMDKPKQAQILEAEMRVMADKVVITKLQSADDAGMNSYYLSERELLQHAQRLDPVACGKSVVSGRPPSDEILMQIPKAWIDNRQVHLAAVIRSVGTKPARTIDVKKAEDAMEGAMQSLHIAYGEMANSFGQYTGDKLELIGQCRMAVHFFKYVELMPVAEKANFYRYLLKMTMSEN